MIDTRRQNQQIVLFNQDADPFISLAANIEVAFAIKDVADFLVFVQVFAEKHFHFLLVDGTHFLRGDSEFITVLVAAFSSEVVDIVDRRASLVDNTKRSEICTIDDAARVVRGTLVTLCGK